MWYVRAYFFASQYLENDAFDVGYYLLHCTIIIKFNNKMTNNLSPDDELQAWK